ncbi:hypothetical protein Tco_0967638 [Tanacetum coccineum]
MSEADSIPPTSSVTALRIPMIKKGEYDLFKLKKPWWAIDNNEKRHGPRNLMLNYWTFALWALTEVEQDEWSNGVYAEHVNFGQDGLGDFDWSNKANDTPVSLALMATNSEDYRVESISGMKVKIQSGNTNSTESSYPNFKKAKRISFSTIHLTGHLEEDPKNYAYNWTVVARKYDRDKGQTVPDFKEFQGGLFGFWNDPK